MRDVPLYPYSMQLESGESSPAVNLTARHFLILGPEILEIAIRNDQIEAHAALLTVLMLLVKVNKESK
jgi:hypothetical protein